MSFWPPHWDIYIRHQTLNMDWFSRLHDMLEVSTACRSLKYRAFLMWCATRMSLSINMNIKPVYHHHMTFYGWNLKGYFWRPLAWPLTRNNTRDRKKIWRSARDAWCIPRFIQWKSHPATFIWGWAPSCWKLKLPSAFKAVRAFRTLTRAPLGYFYNAPHWGGAISSTPLWSPKLLGRF